MKVLMIAPQPFFEPRGTPISVYQRLHGLASLGYEVDLIVYHVGKDVNIPGIKIHRIPHIPFIKNIKIGPSWSKLLLDILVFWKAVVMLLANRYDVIHSHEEAAFFSVILSAVFRTRHLYDMHSSLAQQLANSSFGRYWLLVKLFDMLDRWVINTCDSLITIGADLEEHAIEINPTIKQTRVENLPVHVIESPPDQSSVDELRKKLDLNNRLPVVYTGTFEYYQGLDLLFESVEIVRKHYPEVVFVLVGGKPEQIEYWQAEAKKNNLEECIIFVGTVTPAETLAYLELADILVSPRTEGLSVPLKIYTYLYSGKPIVATRLVAHTQVLNDDNAILVAPEKEAFAEGILKLIRDPDLRQHLGLQAQKFAKEKYSSASYFAKLERVYYSLFFPPTHAPSRQSAQLLEN